MRLTEGLPAATGAAAVAADSSAYCGKFETVFSCTYVFRIGRVVGKVWVTPSASGTCEGEQALTVDAGFLARYATKAAQKIQRVLP